MKEKKTSIITVRTTEWVREELEAIAYEKQWSISQLVEQIILDYLDPINAQITQDDEQNALKLLNLIEKQGTIDLKTVIKLAIENNLLTTFKGMGAMITQIIKEHNEQIEKNQSTEN